MWDIIELEKIEKLIFFVKKGKKGHKPITIMEKSRDDYILFMQTTCINAGLLVSNKKNVLLAMPQQPERIKNQ